MIGPDRSRDLNTGLLLVINLSRSDLAALNKITQLCKLRIQFIAEYCHSKSETYLFLDTFSAFESVGVLDNHQLPCF